MKKTNFTTIQPSWSLGSNWLRGLIPLLAFLAFTLPMKTQAQQAPNCSNVSPAIDENGEIWIDGRELFTNQPGTVPPPVEFTLFNQWGGVIATHTFPTDGMSFHWRVCNYLGKDLEFSLKNSVGTCNDGIIHLDGTPGVVLTSKLQPNGDPAIGEGKINVYCGKVPAPSKYVPSASTPCGGTYTSPKVQPDWVMPFACGEGGDTSEVIFRT